MKALNARDDSTRRSWVQALRDHQLLYPDERVVSFLARRFPSVVNNGEHHAIDIGCGSGRHVKLMLDYGFQTWGIDYAAESVDMVRSAFHGHPLLREVVLGDFRETAFPTSFHAVVAWGVLFLNPPSEMVSNLRGMGRLLGPDGRLLVNFRTRENSHFGLGEEIEPGCFILDDRAGTYKGMCYTFTDLPDVEALVERAGGMDIVHVEKTTFVKNNLSELHSWLQIELKPSER